MTDTFYVGAGDFSETIEHSFETREEAESWKKKKDKEQGNKGFMDKHTYSVKERKITFTGEEEPIHDYGGGYHGEW